MILNRWALTAVLCGVFLLVPNIVHAHCDTLSGPVIADARLALEKGDVTPVLKWVRQENEAEIRAAFSSTMAVRKSGGEAKELADRYFFETLVRIHRAGEGAPYTGLKATPPDPIVAATDAALEKASADQLTEILSKSLSSGIRTRAERVLQARTHAGESVQAGREYVAAYVEFVHYVEGVHAKITSGVSHEHEAGLTAEHAN